MTSYRAYASLGASGGAAVTAAFWFGVGASASAAVVAVAIGATVGAGIGALAGDGSLQSAWAGWPGATVIPPFVVALVNLILFVVFAASHSD